MQETKLYGEGVAGNDCANRQPSFVRPNRRSAAMCEGRRDGFHGVP
jgi:hypothetical protein